MLEKHLIVDRSTRGVDWQAALQPAEFASYVAAMREAYRSLGTYEFQPLSNEDRKYRRFQKKSMVAARVLESGEVIRKADVLFLRVQGDDEGISPIDFAARADGRRTTRRLSQFEQFTDGDLE